ncbi:hypothetical protein B7463_g4651, partial [Scytalidium lignicola]
MSVKPTIKEVFENAVQQKMIPGAVLTARDRAGKLRYSETFGVHSLKTSQPLKPDAVFWLASCTKLMVTVAALQCVERGLFTLDEDFTRILPEWKDKEILAGFEEVDGKQEPIFRKNTTPITLRHMLSHQSGISYDHFNPLLIQYRTLEGKSFALDRSGHVTVNYNYPLIFAPGESWSYGSNVDWAGIAISRTNNNISLEEYMIKNIWKPLGMNDTTFRLRDRPDLAARIPDMNQREGKIDPMFGVTLNPSGKAIHSDNPVWNTNPDDDYGGCGGYSTAPDFQKLLDSLTANDGKVLNKTTVDEMFKSQLTEGAKQALAGALAIPQVNNVLGGGYGGGTKMSWGLGGLLNEDELESGRAPGSICWFGLPCLYWWIDIKKGVSGTYFSQLFPPGDPQSNELMVKFEKYVYERLEA